MNSTGYIFRLLFHWVGSFYRDDIVKMCAIARLTEFWDRTSLSAYYDATREGISLCYFKAPDSWNINASNLIDITEFTYIKHKNKLCWYAKQELHLLTIRVLVFR